MADIARVNGAVAAASFYGLTFQAIRVTATGKFTADTVDTSTFPGYNNIAEGGYSKAVKAVGQCGSIIIQSARASNSNTFAVIVDGVTFNAGTGHDTPGAYGALKDALASECGGVPGDYAIASSSVLNGDGTFTYA